MEENKMGVMPVRPLLLHMAWPMMLSMLIQALYNMVDSMFVSRLNREAFEALSLSYPVQMFMVAVCVGTGVGVNALLSRRLGQQDPAGAQPGGQFPSPGLRPRSKDDPGGNGKFKCVHQQRPPATKNSDKETVPQSQAVGKGEWDHFSSRRIGWDVADATQNDPRIRSVSYDESLSARRPGLEAAGRRDCLSHHLLLPALRTILLPSALSSALSPGAGYSRTDRPHWAAGLPRS